MVRQACEAFEIRIIRGVVSKDHVRISMSPGNPPIPHARSTIERYVNCLIHFGCWLNTEDIDLQGINRGGIDRYLHDLPLVSPSAAISRHTIKMDRAALRHLLTFLPQQHLVIAKNPIEVELERFSDYLPTICGMSPLTCESRCKYVSAFLIHRFSTEPLTSNRSKSF